MVDTSFATLDFTQSRNVRVEGNSFNNVSQSIINPVQVSHTQNTAAETWNVDAGGFVPFGGRIRMVRVGDAGRGDHQRGQRGALCVPLCRCRARGAAATRRSCAGARR